MQLKNTITASLFFALAACGDPRLNIHPELPPVEFVQPFPGVFIVHTETLVQIQKSCTKSIDIKYGDYIYACSIHVPHTKILCEQWLPGLREVTEDMLLDLIKIETANCNGWHDSKKPSGN